MYYSEDLRKHPLPYFDKAIKTNTIPCKHHLNKEGQFTSPRGVAISYDRR